jgi:hypothetical protein
MIDILSTVQALLKDAGYSVRLSEIQKSTIVCFEDGALMGFCCVFETPGDLLKKWKYFETEILTRFAPNFRLAGDKAWNVYCVFLCGTEADKTFNREIASIEEDLDRTRKIAAAGVTSREELIRVLFPIMPLQHRPVLPEEDVTARLVRRIGNIAPKARDIALDDKISPAQIVDLLGEST